MAGQASSWTSLCKTLSIKIYALHQFIIKHVVNLAHVFCCNFYAAEAGGFIALYGLITRRE